MLNDMNEEERAEYRERLELMKRKEAERRSESERIIRERNEDREQAEIYARECAEGKHGFLADDEPKQPYSGGRRAYDPSSGYRDIPI